MTVAVAFDPPLHDALKAISAETGMSFGRLVRRACCAWLASEDSKTVRAAGNAEREVHRSFLMAWKPEEKKKP